ncbi:MAG: RND family transporter [Pseudomonadales bacterium]|nr:RND family transporter [Pseudomonadales bacterium]
MSEHEKLASYQYGSEAKIYERIIFNFRPFILMLFIVATVVLTYQATKTRGDTNFLNMIPTEHKFIKNMVDNLADVGATGTTIQIAVEHTEGDIFDKDFLEVVKQISDEAFYLPGVNRLSLESIWTPNVRWTAVTEEGFEGGPVTPNGYDGSEPKIEELRQNILRSGRVGSLVADNFKSAIISASLFDVNPDTGEPLNYQEFSHKLEQDIREKYQSDTVKIHVIGVAKLVGDLTDAGPQIVGFFGAAFIITMVLLFLYSRCLIGTFAPLICSIIAVIWQLGILASLGYGISAYSMLVPFLVFAIGISHGIQIINTVAINMSDGEDKLTASRHAFRGLYIPGMTALISDGIGFATLYIIDIPAIQHLTIAACIGITVIVFTNLVLLPIIMSYFGITKSGIAHVNNKSEVHPVLWEKVSLSASPKVARISVILMMFGFGIGIYGGMDLKIGDLDAGAPELHPDSRYNLDNKFIADNYTVSSDIFLIMIKTTKDQCSTYENLEVIERFGWVMENVEGVESSVSLSFVIRQVLTGFSEGSLKWNTIPRDQAAIDSTFFQIPTQLVNTDCSYAPLVLFLADHKAETLQRVVAASEKFIAENPMPNLEFLLATGNAGIEAATNDVIGDAQNTMLFIIYAVVIVLIFASFNSLSAVACIVIPLALTSALCQALMAYLGIGVKVATLPVIALGVGIGVDYGIYIYGRLETYLKEGMPLQEAYFNTLKTTGKAVALTGITLAIGVGTWILSPIKFQADMGKLLTFMFLWNMIGALWLLPALAHFLIKPEKLLAKEQKKIEKKERKQLEKA